MKTTSDNDLIMRGEIKAFRRSFVWCGDLVSGVTIEDIDCVPAVPQEMSAREYVRELWRLQNKRKTNCTLDDMLAFLDWEDAMAVDNADNAVSIIEKWAREHPERSEE